MSNCLGNLVIVIYLYFLKGSAVQHCDLIKLCYSAMPLLIYPGETASSKKEKSFENLSQQMMMLKLSDEALELGISAIPPKRLNSSSNILNNQGVVTGLKKSFTGLEKISDVSVPIFNKHYSNNFFKNNDDDNGKKIAKTISISQVRYFAHASDQEITDH